MAKNVQTPDDVQIASMNIEAERIGNLLAPGPGTPWEDRGSIGVIPAFFKTVIMSMTAPGKLLHSIRRPETLGDARIFVIICGVLWGISWVIHDAIAFSHEIDPKLQRRPDFDFTDQGYQWIFHFVLAAVATWLLLGFITRLFYKLVSAGEMKQKFPLALNYTVYAYCLGPSILALIPFYIGPGIAIIWIFLLCVFAAKSRLAIKTNGAIICNALCFGGILGLSAGGYFLLRLIYDKVLG